MGIDAQMFVKTRIAISEDEVRMLAYRLGDAFGHDRFSIVRPENEYGWVPNHCLEIIQEYQQDGPSIVPQEGEVFIEAYLYTRYYGPDYERGDLPFILGVAEWLLRNIPDAEIWYGGDSSGVLAEELTKERRSQLWNHFCKVGHLPYSAYFDRKEFNPPICALCQMQPIQNGSGRGGQWGCFYCPGCGWEIETEDGGLTFHERKKRSS